MTISQTRISDLFARIEAGETIGGFAATKSDDLHTIMHGPTDRLFGRRPSGVWIEIPSSHAVTPPEPALDPFEVGRMFRAD